MRRVGRSFTSSPANNTGSNYRRATAMVFQSGARTACPNQMTRRRKQSPIGKRWHFRSKAADRRQGTGYAATSPARGPRWRRTPNHFRASGIEREVPGSGYLESERGASLDCRGGLDARLQRPFRQVTRYGSSVCSTVLTIFKTAFSLILVRRSQTPSCGLTIAKAPCALAIDV
jgi:hypothetical protein